MNLPTQQVGSVANMQTNDITTTEGHGEKLNLASRPGGGNNGLASKRNFSAPPGRLAKKQWKTAFLKAKELPDPWEGYAVCTVSHLCT